MSESEQIHFESHRKKPKRTIAIGVLTLMSACSAFDQSIETTEYSSLPVISEETNQDFSRTPDWEQDFTELTALNSDIWSHQDSYRVPGWNNIESIYTSRPKNVRLEDGVGLIIEAHREPYTHPEDPSKTLYEYTSGRIRSVVTDSEGFTFEYGKVEATIKMPAGKGTWPAFWLRSNNQELIQERFTEQTKRRRYSVSPNNQKLPYLLNGEIDFEVFGGDSEEVQIAHHTFKDKTEKIVEFPENNDGFNTYGIAITPDYVDWTINNRLVYREHKKSDNPAYWPYKDGNDLYIILNLAMGGRGGDIDEKQDNWQLIVKNLSFYSYIG